MSLFLGIDTSNYTTSVALCGENTASVRKIIDVKEGERGIRQSEGVFAHVRELPHLLEGLDSDVSAITAIGVSTRPRSVEGSYMPVFVAGESFARTIAKVLGVPLFRYSHQDGHIMAGIVSADCTELMGKPFTAVHMSGGTTEILRCAWNGDGFDTEIIGGTKDISAGQLIDRLGVRLGMKFPCGKEFDALSLNADREIPLKTAVSGGYMNLSGMENKLSEKIGREHAGVLARSALIFIGKSLAEAINSGNPERVLFVGGVASNTLLRRYLSENVKVQTYFASGELACDNAVGIAELAKRSWSKWNR
ncbi:MAG: hypothetical protein PUE13_00740 [Clostridiales bacterium]|nr:hypothetical protein [Clostridiales bacterium]